MVIVGLVLLVVVAVALSSNQGVSAAAIAEYSAYRCRTSDLRSTGRLLGSVVALLTCCYPALCWWLTRDSVLSEAEMWTVHVCLAGLFAFGTVTVVTICRTGTYDLGHVSAQRRLYAPAACVIAVLSVMAGGVPHAFGPPEALAWTATYLVTALGLIAHLYNRN